MKAMSPTEHAMAVRRLQGEINSALKAADEAKLVATAAQKREAGNRARVKLLQDELATVQAVSTDPIVSEHAMLRWLERVEGLDLENLRKHILADSAASINFAVNGEIKRGKHTLVFKDRVIVTIKDQK